MHSKFLIEKGNPFRSKTGRVWCGGARETRKPYVTIG